MSLIPTTYDGLVSGVKALAEDDSSEFTAYIPTAIHLAEENMVKVLKQEHLEATVTVTATAGDPYINKPTGYRYTHDFSFRTSAGNIVTPNMKKDHYLKDYWPSLTATGTPKYYSTDGASSLRLAPTPASAYPCELKYRQQVTHLSALNQTNFYTDYCSEALFYGTMVGMAEFMKDYTTLPVWQGRYMTAIELLNAEGQLEETDNNTKDT